jgi:hypothetical protein
MQSYEKEGVAARAPNTGEPCADSKAVKSPIASHPKKPMPEAYPRGRPSAISTRSRIQIERHLNDLFAPLFHYLPGVAFRFPDDGAGAPSAAALLLDGDLMYCPAENGKKPSPSDQYMDGAILVAKFRQNSGLSLQNGAKLEGVELLAEVLIVNGLLKRLARLISSNDTAGGFGDQSPGSSDYSYFDFHNAVQTIFLPTTSTYVKKIVEAHITTKS